MSHRVVVCTVAYGGWYRNGVARMIQEFERHSPGIELQAWMNVLPPGARRMEENGYDYTGYASKPWALKYALDSGADIALLLDAAFYPIRSIHPMLDYIAQIGYYLCDNGNMLGDWCSDKFLEQHVWMQGGNRMSESRKREHARTIREVSSYAVGVNRHNPAAMQAAESWALRCCNPGVVCGPHTATGFEGRNIGPVSSDAAVRGHRHDQSALSALAYECDLTELCQRPRFTAYLGSETEQTVLVNRGM